MYSDNPIYWKITKLRNLVFQKCVHIKSSKGATKALHLSAAESANIAIKVSAATAVQLPQVSSQQILNIPSSKQLIRHHGIVSFYSTVVCVYPLGGRV